ncbi:MAG: T9SS type A sorting domain-containing protein [Bacteroidia bacterium]|nr:T9SS type A sorting domain-containing protein [Bacteroidia bacterium]
MKHFLIFCYLLIQSGISFSQSNIGFELGNTSGWVLEEGLNTNSTTMGGCCPLPTSNAAVVSQGNDLHVGAAIKRVGPGAGNYSLRLGSTATSGIAARATYTFNVSPANPIFSFQYAMVTTSQDNDSCHQTPYFDARLMDINGTPIPNSIVHINSPGVNCTGGDASFVTGIGQWKYRDWAYTFYDLNNYIGMTLTVQFTAGSSTNGLEMCYAYIDAGFDIPPFTLNGTGIPPGQTNVYICENSLNNLCAPAGSAYNWTGPNVTGQTGQCVNVTAAGSYSVILAQGSNSVSVHYNFLEIPTPSLSIITSADNGVCAGPCTGSISASVVGSANYDWNFLGNGLSFSPMGTPTFSAGTLCGGTYTLILKESGTPISCPVTTVVTIQGSTTGPPSINPVTQTITCVNPTVTLDANPSFTNPAYEYVWTGSGITGSVNTQSVVVSQAGNYTVVATNTLSSCSTTSVVSVFSNTITPPVSINATQGSTLNCGQCISLNPVTTNTNNLIAVSYSWLSSSGVFSNIPTVSVCTAGIYTLNVTYSNGCTATTTEEVYLGQSLLTATVTPTINDACPYLSNGSIQLAVSPSGNYTYTWTDTQHNLLSTNPNIYNLPAGNYFFNITDGTACTNYSYVVPTGTSDCSSISGNIFNDVNRDCVKNPSDADLNGIKVLASPGNYFGLSDASGNYTIYAPLGTYTLSQIQFPSPFIAPNCALTLTANLNTSDTQLSNLNFSDTLSSVADGKIPSLNTSGIVPGFNSKYYVSVGNNMANGFTGVLKFVKSPLLSYTTFTPSATSVNSDTAYFNVTVYNNLNQQFQVGFYAPPSLPLGLSIPACAYLNVNGNDINLVNNTLCYNRVTTGSFDPNDKSVSPAGIGAEGFISTNDSILTYKIRFQNTGTGPAVNIVIEDTLSQNLDPLSFDMLGSSHDYKVDVLQGNVLRWKFSNIMLPDSNTNEPASHGFVYYRIKQKHGNTPGTQIKNTAYIYFDFNEPVVTNTTLNTIETLTGIQSHGSSQNSFDVYPNPSSSAIHIKIADVSIVSKTYSIKIMDVLGKEILTTNYKEEINISNLEKGIYFLSVYQNKLLIGTKKVIKE